MKKEPLIRDLYQSFNLRDIKSVLAHFADNVEWPNGWEGGYVYGHAAVRDYWTRQWQELDPEVTPIEIEELAGGVIKVLVHQLVKDRYGKILSDGPIFHLYSFSDDKVTKMEIVPCENAN